jgi:hypothetical protein
MIDQKNKTPETREDISVLLEDEDRLQKGAGNDKAKRKEAKEAKRVNLKRKRKVGNYSLGISRILININCNIPRRMNNMVMEVQKNALKEMKLNQLTT